MGELLFNFSEKLAPVLLTNHLEQSKAKPVESNYQCYFGHLIETALYVLDYNYWHFYCVLCQLKGTVYLQMKCFFCFNHHLVLVCRYKNGYHDGNNVVN